MIFKQLLKRILTGDAVLDRLTEGVYADQYKGADIRQRIAQRYIDRHTPEVTPLTDPLSYDPLTPPPGWRYDPYYERWIEFTR
jgi:hypothetical protein